MTGQERYVNELKNNPNSLAAATFFNKLEEEYINEFGANWVASEKRLAKKIIIQGVTASISIGTVVEYFFREIEQERSNTGFFIGTRQVSDEQFRWYSKGIYWMAGYTMLNAKIKKIK